MNFILKILSFFRKNEQSVVLIINELERLADRLDDHASAKMTEHDELVAKASEAREEFTRALRVHDKIRELTA